MRKSNLPSQHLLPLYLLLALPRFSLSDRENTKQKAVQIQDGPMPLLEQKHRAGDKCSHEISARFLKGVPSLLSAETLFCNSFFSWGRLDLPLSRYRLGPRLKKRSQRGFPKS